MAGGERFPREARLRRTKEIRATFREGCRSRAGPVDLFARPSPAGRPRVGVVVPRHGRTIVDRNRLERRLREIVRRGWLQRAREEGGALDVVIRARGDAYGATFDDLRCSLLDGLEAVGCEESSSG